MSMVRQRIAQVSQDAAQRKSQSVFLPAPIRGWDTVDPPGIMPADYAMNVTNFWPLQNGLETRGGSVPWCIGLPGDVETVMAHVAGEDKLFAVSGGSIYLLPEAPSTSAVPSEVKSGLGSSVLRAVNFSNNGGTWLWACNGTDAPVMYDGETWQDAAITGVEDDKRPANVCVYQNRMFFSVPGSLTLYYLGLDAIQGAASKLPLGAYFDRGGEITLMGNVTVDGGYGPDDYLIVVTSEGEIVSFKGRNPDSASAWAMVGKFRIARPLGLRASVKWGGDLIIMTEQGVSGISSMLSQELAGLVGAATEKIQPTWAQVAIEGYGKSGWDICVYHRRGLIFVNIPTEYTGSRQFVLNPTTTAWTDMRGWESARCFFEYQGKILAGMNGRVQLLDVFTNDVNPTETGELEGVPVIARVDQAFVQPGGGGVKKRYTIMRPYIISDSQPSASMGISVDNVPSPYQISRIMISTDEIISEWYVSEWDAFDWMVGSGQQVLRTRWVNCNGTGYSVSVAVEIEARNRPATYTGADIQYMVSNTL